MIENLPNYVNVVFGLTTLLTFVLFLNAILKSSQKHNLKWIVLGFIVWLGFQTWASISLFYLETSMNTPPMFPLLGFIPTFILMFVLFNRKT